MLQQYFSLLQGYCSTQLFYFIAYETTSAIKLKRNMYFIAIFFFYFIAHENTFRQTMQVICICEVRSLE